MITMHNLNHDCYGLKHQVLHGPDSFSHGRSRFGASSRILHGVELDPPTRYKEVKASDDFISRYAGTYLKNKVKIEYNRGKWEICFFGV